MDNQQAYNEWSPTYDMVINKTRDLEAVALSRVLAGKTFDHILEIGCGTGKNTSWLLGRAGQLTGVDFSAEMLEKAKDKNTGKNIRFMQADIRQVWEYEQNIFDLIACSPVLEHIENIDFVFAQANKVLIEKGLFYIGELHPFKQYQGTKANFEKDGKIIELECYTHHISDFFRAAKSNAFDCVDIDEWFDENTEAKIPRILTMLFQKNR